MRRFHHLPFWVAAVIILQLLFSCVSEKKRMQICRTCPIKTERHDSIVERLVEVPVILPPVPGPTVYLQSPCAALCDSLGNLKSFYMEKKENGIKTTVKTNTVANTLDISSNLEDSAKTNVSVKQKEVYSITKEQVPAHCDREHTKWYDKYCRWISLASLCFLGGFLAWRFRKFLV